MFHAQTLLGRLLLPAFVITALAGQAAFGASAQRVQLSLYKDASYKGASYTTTLCDNGERWEAIWSTTLSDRGLWDEVTSFRLTGNRDGTTQSNGVLYLFEGENLRGRFHAIRISAGMSVSVPDLRNTSYSELQDDISSVLYINLSRPGANFEKTQMKINWQSTIVPMFREKMEASLDDDQTLDECYIQWRYPYDTMKQDTEPAYEHSTLPQICLYSRIHIHHWSPWDPDVRIWYLIDIRVANGRPYAVVPFWAWHCTYDIPEDEEAELTAAVDQGASDLQDALNEALAESWPSDWHAEEEFPILGPVTGTYYTPEILDRVAPLSGTDEDAENVYSVIRFTVR